MSVGITALFEIAKRAMHTAQFNMNVIGHNIANADRPEYSRQKAHIAASKPMQLSYGSVGTGVDVTGVTRQRDSYIDLKVRAEINSHGTSSYRNNVLSHIEASFNEPSDYGLNTLMSKFWDGWQEVINNPESSAARSTLIQRASQMTDQFNNLSVRLEDFIQMMNEDLVSTVTEINLLAEQIAELNKYIATMDDRANLPNDLMDERDALIDKLFALADVQYIENDNHTINITLDGRALVDGASTLKLKPINKIISDNRRNYIVWEKDLREVNISGGELKGLFNVRDIELQDFIDRLDNLAKTMVQEVNEKHVRGFGLDGSGDHRFFSYGTTGAGDFALSQDVIYQPNNIAAALEKAPGDNANAQLIYNLRDELLMGGDVNTFNQYYGNIISDVGAKTQAAADAAGAQDVILEQMNNKRQEMMGVSLDDEMVDLIKIQTAYQAAAKIISMTNDVMQSLLNMV